MTWNLTLPLAASGTWRAQPSLSLDQPVLAGLDDLIWPQENSSLYRQLMALGQDTAQARLCIAGEQGSGRTAVLKSICSHLYAPHRSVSFVNCREPDEYLLPAMAGIGGEYLVCLDDLDVLSGREEAQGEVVELFDRSSSAAGSLLVSVSASDGGHRLLPDLQSRLRALADCRLHPLNSAQRKEALGRRAQRQQLSVPDATIDYLVRHCQPDMATTVRAFKQLVAMGQMKQRVPGIALAREVLLAGRGLAQQR